MTSQSTGPFRVAIATAPAAFVAVSLLTWLSPCYAFACDPRPNIVIVLSDDIGFSDIGCYGGEIQTPNLDRLGKEGIRFTQFYNTGRCCPTRASLLTGLYPHQAGIGWMVTDRGHDGYRGDLNRDSVTIAEVLRQAGYATYMVGKWHVTKYTQPEGPKDNWPLQRGFQRFYGTITGAGNYFDPATLVRDNIMISAFADPQYRPETYYYTHAVSDHAERMIREHAATYPDQPFFLYVAYTAAHWPLHALEKDIAKYRGRYDEGYAAIRASRFERLKSMGLIDGRWELSPQVGNWDEVKHKEWEARCMEVYAAQIDSMDQGIGRILEALRATGQWDKTVFFYLQDNGGCQEAIGRTGEWRRPVAPTLPPIPPEVIRTEVRPAQNRAGVPTLTGPNIMPGPEDTYISYGIHWANVSNTPFREYKHYVHEGGIATPLIVHWPAGIVRPGRLETQPAHLIDLMPTCVELAVAEYPAEFRGQKIQPMEGVSLLPLLRGGTVERSSPLFWEHEGNRAVRDGKWKLVAKENRPWELYDMESDRTEMHDLAAEHPEIIARLSAAWDAWAERANVLPLGAWRASAERLSDRKSFTLRHGDALPRTEAPNVVAKGVHIVARVSEMGQGVVVAHGGTAHGYALYFADGRPCFAVREGGKLTTIVPELVPSDFGAGEVAVDWEPSGRVTLRWNGRVLAEREGVAVLKTMPRDGLSVGLDDGGLVGEYGVRHAFSGRIESVTIELRP